MGGGELAQGGRTILQHLKCSYALIFNADCAESVLETLTDIGHEYFVQMTRLLRHAVDNEALHGGTGFQVSDLPVGHAGVILKLAGSFKTFRILQISGGMQYT